jgi:arylsulfatase
MKRRDFLKSVGMAGAALAAPAWLRAADAAAEKRPFDGARGRPNFVIIFTDDQGYQDVGCFGSPQIRTPRLDRMAAEGTRFTSFYAQPICGPSRAAIMTGCYPLRVAERGNTKSIHPVLHAREITVAEVLKARGYATAMIGKWDLARHSQRNYHADLMPNGQGFDFFFGTPTSNDSIADLHRNGEFIAKAANMSTLTRRYTDEAVAFIARNTRAWRRRSSFAARASEGSTAT